MEAQIPDVMATSDFRDTLAAFTPRPRWKMLDWCREKIVTDQGRHYDHGAYPHLGAPGGPCDAFDDPRTRTISLEWATRLGKSFFGQCAMLKTADTEPAPMMFCSTAEKLSIEVIQRTYAMARKSDDLRRLLLKPIIDQKRDLIEFMECQVFVAWARSAGTLADKNIKVGHANELDDWEHRSTSKDGDPQKLFSDRFKDYQSTRKVIYESVPKIRGKSRIEALRLAGTNCRYWVPCKHCGRYQTLDFRNGEKFRVIWETDENGKQNPSAAKKSARYRCRHCEQDLPDYHRAWMIRRGVWCPEGCEVIDDEARIIAEHEIRRKPGEERLYDWRGWSKASWVSGNPTRDGEDASYQLSSLYALSLSWGDIAKEFVVCHKKPQLLRNFVNQWLGETWEMTRTKSDPEKVGERLRGETERGIVPEGGLYLTFQCDRQEGFVVWSVLAHGEEERAWLVDYGIAQTLTELWDTVIRKHYKHADGGPALVPMAGIIDSGFNTKDTYDFCNSHHGMFPCKGASNDMGGQPYRIVVLGRSNTGIEDQKLVYVGTDFWETELQERLTVRLPGEPGSLTLCAEASRDGEFLEQLCNGTLDDRTDTRGMSKLLWVKKDENIPNDFRDGVRYGLCLGKACLDELGGVYPKRIGEKVNKVPEVIEGLKMEDGREWGVVR